MLDFIKSLLIEHTNRLKNPFISSYLISLLTYNWKSLTVILISDVPIIQRIEFIENSYLDQWSYFAPLILSTLYTFGFPYFTLLIDAVTNAANKKKIIRINKRKKAFLINRKNEATLEREIAEEIAGTKKIEILSKQINDMKDEIDNLKNNNIDQNNKYNDEIRKLNDIISKNDKEANRIKEELKNERNERIYFNEYIHLLKETSVVKNKKIKDYLKDKLLENEIIELVESIKNGERLFLDNKVNHNHLLLMQSANLVETMSNQFKNIVLTKEGEEFVKSLSK